MAYAAVQYGIIIVLLRFVSLELCIILSMELYEDERDIWAKNNYPEKDPVQEFRYHYHTIYVS